MNEERFEIILNELQLQPDQLEVIKSDDADADSVKDIIGKRIESIRENQRKFLENDSDFISKFKDDAHKAALGKERGTFENQLKAVFGLTDADLKDEQGRKPYSKILESVKGKFETAPPEIAELQKENAALRQAQDELIDTHGKTVEQVKAEYEAKFAQRVATDQLRRLVGQFNTIASEAVTLPALTTYLNVNGYVYGIDESNGFSIKKPDGTFPASPDKKDIWEDPKQLIEHFLKSNSLIKESNGSPGTPPKIVNPDPERDVLLKQVAPGLAEAQRNLEAQKAMFSGD